MRKRSSMYRLLSMVLALVMVLSLTVPVLATEQGSLNIEKVDDIFGTKLTAQQEAMINEYDEDRDPEEEVRVSIVLDKKGTIQAGFDPKGIAANNSAIAYRDALKAAQEEMTATIESTLGGELDVVWNLTLAANIISANVKYGQIKAIRAIPGIVAVVEESVYQPEEPVENNIADPNMSKSKSQIGSETAWQAGYTGAGSKIAIVDTGLDYQHEAFSAEAFEYSLNQLGGSVDLMTKDDISSVLRQLNVYSRKSSVSASSLYYNSKVPFGFNYAQNNYTITHSSQAGEHGSHVAGISAANKYVKKSGTFYKALDKTSVQGVAPDAQLLIMNVFGNSAGCYSSDYMAAIEDAVILGADSVNLSLGSGNPGLASSYIYEEILNDLVASGVVVAMSAGNSGHWYDADINGVPFLYLDDVGTHTGGSPGTYANSLCVASVDSANAATASYYTISSFSSWGVPGSLTMKPEISAPGGNIYSVAGYVPSYITNHTSYEYMSGTSMASPQVAGMAAVVAQYIRENNLEGKTGLDARTLAQSLLMSTAEPMKDSSGRYYPILRQGAGMGHVGNSVTADSYILMNENATASWADGKVKAELGDDPNRTGTYTFTFSINNITNSAKSYNLRADVFTQAAGVSNGVAYMDRITDELEATVTFNVGGSAGGNRDYDRDGDVDTDDGLYLLGCIAGLADHSVNTTDADLNQDGRVNTYDAYLFFTTTDGVNATNSVQVPANSSVEVTVTISLTAAQKQLLNQHYTKGAYVQAYVFAESSTTSHSIPVLGFYGSWTDPSMYDKGDAMAFYHEEETRAPYLYDDLSKMNTIMYKNSEGNVYHLGGNPAVKDSQYYPERNAINSQSESIYSVGWTQIRNAGEGYAIVRSTQSNTFYTKRLLEDEGVIGAFYYVNAGQWYNHWYEETGLWSLSGIPENTPLEVGIVMVPEYYTLREGGYSFDELGDGAFLTVPVTIDNTKPTVSSANLTGNDTVLSVEASDNQYVAAIALLDSNGNLLTYTGALADAQKNTTQVYNLDVSEINGNNFYIQAYDYAGNTSLYEVELQLGEVVDYVTGVTLTAYTNTMRLDETYTFVANVQPENASNRNVTWSSSNTNVATVSSTGVVTAKGIGSTTIKATSVLDPSYYVSCTVTVSSNGGVFLSGMLNNTSGKTVLYNLDVDGASWSTAKNGPDYMYTSAVQIPGTTNLYALDYENYTLDKIDSSTGSFVTVASSVGRPLSDITYSSYFSTNSNPKVHAIGDCLLFPNTSPTSFSTGTYFDFEDALYTYTRATYLLALTSAGPETHNGTSTEHLIALDNKGYLWDFWVYPKDGGYSCWYDYTRSDLTSAGAKLGGRIDGNDNYHSWHSMEMADDGTIYLMAYYWYTSNGSTSRRMELYTIEYTGSSYDATYMGHMGADVYPANITSVTKGNGIYSTGVKANCQRPEARYHMDSVSVAEGQKTGRFAMTLDYTALDTVNAGPAAAAPEAEAAKTLTPVVIREIQGEAVEPQSGETVALSLYAKDANGNKIATTNGMFQVVYNPAHLTLVEDSFDLPNANYAAVKIDRDAGIITAAYVGPDRIETSELMAQLKFVNNTDQNTVVRVMHMDYNDADSAYMENITIQPQTKLVQWVQATTSLEGNIGLNFYVKLAPTLVNNSTTFMRFEYAGKTIDVPLADAVVSGDQFKFTCPINAKNMADAVSAQVMISTGAVGEGKSLAVMTYCNYMIQYSRDANLVKLMKAMLNYGTSAQMLFKHNTDNPANAALSPADQVLHDVDASAYSHVISGTETGLQLYNATLLLETETSIRVYFKLTGTKTIDDYRFYVNGKLVEAKMASNQYYVEIPNIAAQYLDNTYHVFAQAKSNSTGGIHVYYGPLSYVNQVINNANLVSAELVDAAKALFHYNMAAKTYFAGTNAVEE